MHRQRIPFHLLREKNPGAHTFPSSQIRFLGRYISRDSLPLLLLVHPPEPTGYPVEVGYHARRVESTRAYIRPLSDASRVSNFGACCDNGLKPTPPAALATLTFFRFFFLFFLTLCGGSSVRYCFNRVRGVAARVLYCFGARFLVDLRGILAGCG